MRVLKDDGDSKHVYLKGRWLSLLINFFTHSSIQYFGTEPWTSYCVTERIWDVHCPPPSHIWWD